MSNTRPETLEEARDLIDMLHERLRKADENMRAMQRDQLESDKGAMMFIAALVDRFGEDYNDGKLVVLSDLQLLKASEMTLGKANPPSGGLRLWTSIERETEAALREGYNKVRAELPPVSPFRTSLELPPDHVITGDAAAARGARMLKTAAPGEKT
jgi:hypothetical protein